MGVISGKASRGPCLVMPPVGSQTPVEFPGTWAQVCTMKSLIQNPGDRKHHDALVTRKG